MLNTPKSTALTLCISTALLAGCASHPKKPVAVEEPPIATNPSDKSANTDQGAKTGSLNNGEALNGSNLGADATSGAAGNDAAGSGKAAKAGSNDSSAVTGNTSGADSRKSTLTLAQLLSTRLVHFDYDSADLKGDDYQTLLAHAQYLKKNPGSKVTLAGHADERGTREYNMALGEHRAKSVEAFLSTNGAASTQIETVSFGKEKPANDGHDDTAWAENRRVEILYDAGEPK